MSTTSQAEYATAKVPQSVWVAKPSHIESIGDELPSVLQKIGSGRAFLKVVAYPWGVEFDVCEGDESR